MSSRRLDTICALVTGVQTWALPIYALLDGALRGPAVKSLASWIPDQLRAKDRHPMMMVVATRAMLPLALVVGIYIFLRGHNQPGGGFIAGLVVGLPFLMQYMASGFGWAERRLRFDYPALLGWGVRSEERRVGEECASPGGSRWAA